MTTTDLTQIVNDFIAAFNAGDWARFRAQLDPAITYDETGTGRHTGDADAYVALCQGWRDAFPDAHGTIRRVVTSDATLVQDILWEGTHTGPLATSGGPLPPSGRAIAVQATFWATLRDGRIVAAHHHLDLMTMLAQIGALPSA